MAKSIYSVTQVTAYIKNMFTQDFALKKISVRGEVSNCKYHSTGHIYFSLKDENGMLKAVMFRSAAASGLNFRLENGMKVVAEGSINVYEKDGVYQLYVQKLTSDGVGDLFLRYEQLKKELSEMGMFDASYKQPVPRFAQKIGVVTSPTGAAIRDIINITERRNPCVKLYLYPALVQGERAASSIAKGIKQLDRMGLDVIIVGRGGGSIEDLWAFNEEETAYAIFHCSTPVISAVGHETDFTIADFVADLRAPTPSAAAELAVFDYYTYINTLRVQKDRLTQAMNMQLERKKSMLLAEKRRLKLQDPALLLAGRLQYLDSLSTRLDHAFSDRFKETKNHYGLLAARLEAGSPLKKLVDGFGYISNEQGAVKGIDGLEPGSPVMITFHDGRARAVIEECEKGVSFDV